MNDYRQKLNNKQPELAFVPLLFYFILKSNVIQEIGAYSLSGRVISNNFARAKVKMTNKRKLKTN